MYRKIKEITGQDGRLGTTGGIKDKKREILFEKEDIKKRWAEYVEELFHDDREEKSDIVGDEELEILQSEVETALNRMKDRKAPVPDGIAVECLKALNNESLCILTKLCNQIYRSGIFPEEEVSLCNNSQKTKGHKMLQLLHHQSYEPCDQSDNDDFVEDSEQSCCRSK